MARPSRIPQAILDVMASGRRHAWTLEQIGADLDAAGQGADFSSIYRGIERLLAQGRVARVGIDDGTTRYELAAGHHDHLHCTRCDAVEAIPCLVRAQDLRALEAQTGFAIAAHSVVLGGLCPRCRQADPEHSR